MHIKKKKDFIGVPTMEPVVVLKMEKEQNRIVVFCTLPIVITSPDVITIACGHVVVPNAEELLYILPSDNMRIRGLIVPPIVITQQNGEEYVPQIYNFTGRQWRFDKEEPLAYIYSWVAGKKADKDKDTDKSGA